MSCLFYSHANRHFIVESLFWLALIFLIFVGCDDGSYSFTGEGGSVAFQIEWVDGDGASKEASANIKRIDQSVGIDQTLVFAQIYNQLDEFVIQGGPWFFSDRTGSISGVPPGSNYKVVVLRQFEDYVIERGEAQINIVSGTTTDAGLIQMHSFIPVLSYDHEDCYSKEFCTTYMHISWPQVTGSTNYRIQLGAAPITPEFKISNDFFVESTINEIEFDPEQPPRCSWRVRASDQYNNIGQWASGNAPTVGYRHDICGPD